MTGFASTTLDISAPDGYQTNLTISLKSLNSRFFEITCKLPPILSHLETSFIKLLKEKLRRGNIFLAIYISNQTIFQEKVEPSITVAKSYIAAIKRIKEECALPGDISIADMLCLANTIFIIEQKACDKSVEHVIFQALQSLVDSLIMTRIQEGKVLQKDIQQRHTIIENNMQTITEAAHDFMERKKQEVARKIIELAGESPEFIQMRKSALYIELDKIDIHEEIVRFNAHLENLQKLFDSKEQEKGRHINFIIQELGREINTLAAKCSDVYIGSLAINIKVELEKIREQAQNIV